MSGRPADAVTTRRGGWTDLARVRAVRSLLGLRAFPSLVVLPTLALVVIALVSAAVGLEHPAVNFGTVVTWVVWWGLLLISLVLVGRAWCLACPLGALGEWVQRLSLGWPSSITPGFGVRWPRRLANAWLPTALFVVFVFLDNGYGMSNSPRLTAALITIVALASVWAALVFERRAFCRFLCPLTTLIGLGALAAPFDLRRRDAALCARCRNKDCYAGNARAWGCPMGEFPGGGMDTNAYCILCAECVRSCPHDNVTLGVRPPGQGLSEMRRARLDGGVGAGVVVALATVVPLCTLATLPWLRAMLARALPPGEPPNDPPRLVALGLLFVLGIALTLALVWGASRLASWAARPATIARRGLFVRIAYALVPIALARMLADLADHALRTWGALEHVTRALLLDFPWNGVVPSRLGVAHAVSPWAVYALQVALLLGGLTLALSVARRLTEGLGLPEDAAERSVFPIAGLALLLTLTGIWTLGIGLL